MATKKVSGSNGTLKFSTLGVAQSDTGTLTAGWWVIVTVGVATGFPVNSGATGAADVAAGYMIYSDGTVTLAAGDSARLVTGALSCDINEWSLEFAKDEVESTTFCDTSKTYIVSDIADITGSINGINMIGVTDQPGGITSEFISIVNTPNDGATADFYASSTTILFAELYTNKESTNGENIDFYFLPISLSSYSASAAIQGSPAQAFSSSFRVASSDDVKPALYTRAGA